MTPSPLALALLTLWLATGCGPESSPDTGAFGWELLVDKAVADQASAFQIVVLPNGKQRDCAELQKTCLKQQVKTNEPLMLRDAKGSEARALRFLVNLNGGTSQDVTIEAPVGRDYALIIEAMSKTSPPGFLGSSCNYLTEGVKAGRNSPLLAAPITLTAVDCDPTF